MDLSIIDKNSPLGYKEWLIHNSNILPDNSSNEYLLYLKHWYFKNSKIKKEFSETLRTEYIQLLKDLSFLFSSDEINLFVSQLDYTNDEEIIFAIPFFAKKLKQIALIFNKKREDVKQAKLKYNLIGSNYGIEKLLSDYILKGFTKNESNLIRVPSYELYNNFPELSSVSSDFYIEIEELHDKNAYLDSDPSLKITDYVDVDKFNSKFIPEELSNLSQDEILNIISTKFLPKSSTSFLSKVFQEFLSDIPNILTSNEYNTKALNFLNLNEASKKYLSQPIYGLTAVKLKDVSQYDDNITLNIETGNNWFYFPSGDRVFNDSVFSNLYSEILINNSNLIQSGATGGDSYMNSDLIFTDKSGIVEGAWLRGIHNTKPEKKEMRCIIGGSEHREFIFPYPGIGFSPKTPTFNNYTLDDNDNFLIDRFESSVKEQILKKYFTIQLPTSSCNSIYLNNSSLIFNGAYADTFSDTADNIIKKVKTNNSNLKTYDEYTFGEVKQAYLYKFDKTDIIIKDGLNNIYWPLQNYTTNPDIKLTIGPDHSLPINLSEISIPKTMSGAVAGLDFQTGDVIYKLNSKNSDPTEATWLGSAPISRLDTEINTIKIYDIPAVKCAEYFEGPIQPSLSIKIDPSEKKSFIWMDEDTYADDVFKHTEHLPSCPYVKDGPYDYYSDQDYQNENPLSDIAHWKKCNCKSLQYSPIGHSGDIVTDYNGMCDYLFADPDGLGEDFNLKGWSDTRNLTYKNSPQFSFYKLNKTIKNDINVGWGSGYWKTSNGTKMVLKTGRRYTYIRNSLRSEKLDTPFLVCIYKYNKINGLLTSTDGFDLVIVIDRSKSQSLNLETTKTCVKNIINKLLATSDSNKIQISLVVFGLEPTVISYLSRNREQLILKVDTILKPTINEVDTWRTDIQPALTIANTILKEEIITRQESSTFKGLCNDLKFRILDDSLGTTFGNKPQIDKPKKILFFSDGYVETGNDFADVSSDFKYVYSDKISYLEDQLKTVQNELKQEVDNFNKIAEANKKTIEENEKINYEYNLKISTYVEALNAVSDVKQQKEDEVITLQTTDNTIFNNVKASYIAELTTRISNIDASIAFLTNVKGLKPKQAKDKLAKNKNKIQLLYAERATFSATLTQAQSVTGSSSLRDLAINDINTLNASLNPPKKNKQLPLFKKYPDVYKKLIAYKIQVNNIKNLTSPLVADQATISIINENIDNYNDITDQLTKDIDILNKKKLSLIQPVMSEEDNINYETSINKLRNLSILEQETIEYQKQNEFKQALNNFINTNFIGINKYLKQKIDILKSASIQFLTVDIGLKSYDSDIMEYMSSKYSNYFNLQKYLDYGDGDIYSFISYISMRLYGSMPVVPIWYKAKRDSFGGWVKCYDDLGNLEISDMVLYPGDYLIYVHRSTISYYSLNNPSIDFSYNSLCFSVNVKLNGWDYEKNTFSTSNMGSIYGAKPYWGEVIISPNEEENFNKETTSFGGKIKFIDDYLPIQQPNVSDIYLNMGCVIEYIRKKQDPFMWKQPITIFDTDYKYVWNKLSFKKDISNLKDILNKQKLDGIVIESNEPSDLILEGYSSYKPVKYNYYARNPFTYNQGLYRKNRCLDSFSIYNTAIIIRPSNPHENILNVHFPTIATSPLPYDVISTKEVGEYLIPENLGVSYYRGRGYNISLDNNSLDTIKLLGQEQIYFDLEKYGPRNRGLTKKDQKTIVKIDSIDNNWIMEPYSSAEKSGIIINTRENQKMTPYQTSYEIENKNHYGLSRQDDNFKFWNPEIPATWTDENIFPLTIRKEISKDVFIDRKNKLLVNNGKLDTWKMDIFGNEYGLYKPILPDDFSNLELWFSADYGVLSNDTLKTIAIDGQKAVTWLNKSSKIGNDLTVYSGSPIFNHSGINNVPSISFNISSTTDVMKNTYEINLNELSFIIVGRSYNYSVTSLNCMVSFGDNYNVIPLSSAALTLSLSSNTVGFSYGNISNKNQLDFNTITSSVDLTSKHIFEFEFKNSNCFSYIDGSLIAQSNNPQTQLNSNIYSNKGMWIGSYINSLFKSSCEISEIILYSKVLNSIEKQNLYVYINKKYSIF